MAHGRGILAIEHNVDAQCILAQGPALVVVRQRQRQTIPQALGPVYQSRVNTVSYINSIVQGSHPVSLSK